ncbi:MAG: acyltransferase [Lysobacteraceae bacterium]
MLLRRKQIPRTLKAAISQQPSHARLEIPALTGLRGVAALWVLVFHAWQFAGAPPCSPFGIPLSSLLGSGWMGVDLFFVLSGFLLGAPFAQARREGRPTPDLARFWRRRIGRVLPAYWGQLLILAGIACWASGQWPMTAIETLAQFTLTQNLLPVFREPLNPVHWSLPVEWDFYLLLPLLALPWRRLNWWQALAAAMVFSLLWRLACVVVVEHWQADGIRFYTTILQFPSRVDEFAAGMAAGMLAGQIRARSAGWLVTAGSVIVVALAFALSGVGDFISGMRMPWVYSVYSVLAVGFGMVVLGAAAGNRWIRHLLANPPLRAAGIISYSLYLWHYPILEWLRAAGWIGPEAGFTVTVSLTLAASAAVSTLSWWLLERPFHAPPRRPASAPERPQP